MSIRLSTPLEHALKYAERGFSVFPVHTVWDGACSCRGGKTCPDKGKHPRTRKGIKAATLDVARIKHWWKTHPESNIGLATGAVSRIVALDIDPRNGGTEILAELIRSLGELPPTPNADTGGGGQHFIFGHPGGQIRNRQGVRPGIDIKEDGGFIVVEPSIHASGRCYRWRQGLDPREMAPAELPAIWLEAICAESRDGDAEERRLGQLEDSGRNGRTYISRWAGDFDLNEATIEQQLAIRRAVDNHLPKGPGERNQIVFAFARTLLGITGRVDPRSLRPVLQCWFEKAEPQMSGDHSLDDCWNDFVYAWPRIHYPGDFDLGQLASEIVKQEPHPACAELGYDNPHRVLLVGLCARLQELNKDAPFFLSARKAADILTQATGTSTNKDVCNQMLNGLVADGVLEVVEKGKPGRATRYRFVWSPGKMKRSVAPDWLNASA